MYACHPVYDNDGGVKVKKDRRGIALKMLSRAARFLRRSSRPLTAFSTPHNRAGLKRSAPQLSFNLSRPVLVFLFIRPRARRLLNHFWGSAPAIYSCKHCRWHMIWDANSRPTPYFCFLRFFFVCFWSFGSGREAGRPLKRSALASATE